jgi:hypothetical protein
MPNSATHYDIEGVGMLPRVTKIVEVIHNPGLAFWASRVGKEEARRIGREAAEHGTMVHTYCERLLRGEAFMVTLGQMAAAGASDAAIRSVTTFSGWLRENKPKVIAIEQLVWTQEGDMGWAGTFDFLLEIRGHRVLVDLKSSKRYSPNFPMQLAGYDLAIEQDAPWYPDLLMVLRIPSNNPTEVIERPFTPDERAESQEAFMNAAWLYSWRERHRNDWKEEA